MIEIKLFEYLDKNSEKNWREFEKKNNCNFFQSFHYIKTLTNITNTKIKIIFVYDDNELIAIYPLEIYSLFGVKILQWIGNNKSDYCNPLISKKYVKIINKKKFSFIWNQIFKKIKNFDLIFLNNQPSEILNFNNPFVKFLDNIKQSKIYKISLLENYEKYLKSIKDKDKKHAYELHRVNIKYEKLKNMYPVNFNIDFIKNDLNYLDLIFLKKSNQLNLKKTKHHLDSNFLNLFKDLVKKNQDMFYLAKFSVNKTIVSACLIIIFKNYIYYYMPVILSEKFNQFKPGKILILCIIKWAITKNIKFFDFGLGDENYKKHFSNNNSFVQKHLSYFSFKGKIIFLFIKLLMFFGYKKN